MTNRGPLLAHTDLKMMGNRSPEEHIQIDICQNRVKMLQERPNGSLKGYKRGHMEVKKVRREAQWKWNSLKERPNGS